MTSSSWYLTDCSDLPPSHCKLSSDKRKSLYKQSTQTFTINKDSNANGLPISNLKSNLSNQSLSDEIKTIASYLIFMSFFFFPFFYIIYLLYLIYNLQLKYFIIASSIYTFLAMYPIKCNISTLQNEYIYSLIKYCSFRMAYNTDTYNHMLTNSKNLIFMNVPHGVLPLCNIIASLITPDLFNGKNEVGTTASIMFHLPGLRNIASHLGYQSVSKQSIKNVLLNWKRSVFINGDGISGIFIGRSDMKTYKDSEVIYLKNRKGISKIALQCGCSVVPTYGFGNTDVMDCWFDKYGILKTISKKLRTSLIILYGRWYLPIPKRVSLYYVVGPIVKSKYHNTPINNPTQKQIDEYHEELLNAIRDLFEQHKQIYGWNHKRLVFV
eukprot:356183_1